jgi:thiol-disulfide isomerase/thioredoxin
MTDKPKYRDKRTALWREHFDLALPYEEYIELGDAAHAAKWTKMAAALPALTKEQAARLQGRNRRLNVLVYSGIWCGDCVRQGPMIQKIADAAGSGADAAETAVEVRFIERDASEELQDELRILGALRVPVVVFLSEDFFEVGRFGDRLLAVYRRKAERETGAACDAGLVAPESGELAAEQAEWVDIFERMLLMLRLAPPLRERYGD